MLNIQTIMYLINYFESSVALVGENAKAVSMFRQNVYDLNKKSMIGTFEILLVEDIIGMRNTDNIKWEKSKERIQSVKKVYSILVSYQYENDSENALAVVNVIQNITDNVKMIFKQIYQPNKYPIVIKELKTMEEKTAEKRGKKLKEEAVEREKKRRIESSRAVTEMVNGCERPRYSYSNNRRC